VASALTARSQAEGREVDFRVLGPLEVHEGADRLSLGSGRRMRTLLALFLAHPNRSLSADMLIESLWLNEPPQSAATGLRVHLTRLRARLEPGRDRSAASERITTEPTGYRLMADPDELDALRFERLISLARRETSRALAARMYADADALWRGRAFADVDDVDVIRAEAARLHELRAVALEEGYDLRLSLGDHAALVGAIRGALDEHPLRERLAAQLMVALYRAGRQAEALRVYTELRDRLGEELGIEPDMEVSRLETAIIRHERELDLPAAVSSVAPSGSARSSTVVVVAGPELQLVAPGANGAEIRIEDGVAWAFSSAREAVAHAAALLRLDNQSTIGISAGEWPPENHADTAPVVSEAAALRAIAPRGGVVASEAVVALAGLNPELHFDAPGPATTPSGVSVSAALSRVESPSHLDATVPIPALLEDDDRRQFAGRTSELEFIDGQRHSQDRALAVFISGEPGIGKTSLAAEAAKLAHADGWMVLYGRCDETVAIPFQPFVDALEFFTESTPDALLRDRLGDHAGDLTRLVPSLTTRVPDVAEPLRSDPETERYRMFQAVAEWLRTNARRQPVLLIIDDLHWAAQPTLLLLRHLVRTPDLAGLQIIVTYRDTKPEQGEALDEVLAHLSRERHIARCSLSGLDEDDVRELVIGSTQMPDGALARDVARAVHAETGGNPLFVHELIRYLPDADALQHIRGTVPPTVRDLLTQRVARLPHRTDELLTIAAVIGRHFDFELLRAVSNIDEDDVLYLLDAALGARLVYETAFDHYRFSHALVQSALYRPLSETRRVRLHRRVAEALKRAVRDDGGQRLPELAHHYLEAAPAGVAHEAAHYAIAAADAALQGLAFEDAANLCRRGLEVIERARTSDRRLDVAEDADVGPAELLELHLLLGRAQIATAHYEAGRASLRNAAEFAIAHDATEELALIALAYNGLRQVEARDEHHIPLLRRALAATEAASDPDASLRSRLLAHLAQALDAASPERVAAAELAAELADIADDPRAVYESRIALFWVRFVDPARAREAYDATQAALVTARLIGDPEMMLHAIQCLIVAGSQVSDHGAVVAAVDEATELAPAVGSPWNKALPLLFEGRVLLAGGRLEQAEKKIAETIAASAIEPTVVNLTGTQLILIYRWQRRLREALALMDVGERGIPPEQRQLLTLMRGCVLADEGSETSRDEARRLLNSAVQYLAPLGTWERPAELVLLADGAATLVDTDFAAAVRPLLQPWTMLELQIMIAAAYGPCRLYLGRLDRVLGELDRAVEELETAGAQAAHGGLRSWSTLAKAELACALSDRARPGDGSRAATLAREAHDEAERLGLVRVLHTLSQFR
jgi:DNA-binding SARP family transcriptional activator